MHPVLFELAGQPFTSYGVALSLAFCAGIWLAWRRARARGLDGNAMLDAGLVVFVSSLVGSRVLFALESPELFRPPHGRWLDLFDPLHHSGLAGRPGSVGISGLSMSAGVALATVCALAWFRWRGLPVLRHADVVAPSVALGEGITRLGCFLNGCCFGRTSSLPWAVSFPSGSAADVAFAGAAVHPTQLYSALVAFALFGALLALDSRGPRPGSVTCAFGVGWAGSRLALDAFRHYPESGVAFRVLGLGVPLHQVVVVALLAAGVAGAVALAARRSSGPGRSRGAS